MNCQTDIKFEFQLNVEFTFENNKMQFKVCFFKCKLVLKVQNVKKKIFDNDELQHNS